MSGSGPFMYVLWANRPDVAVMAPNILGVYSKILAGNAVIEPNADDSTIANIVFAYAAARIQMMDDEIETNTALFRPFFDDLDIHHQRHRYIDVTVILEARDALSSANNLLNTARSRLSTMRSGMAPGLAGDIYDMIDWGLALHSLLFRAELKNHYILQLFRQMTPTTRVFRNTVASQLGSNAQQNRNFSPA